MGGDEIQLVPVTGSGVPPGCPVMRFAEEESVAGAEVNVRAYIVPV